MSVSARNVTLFGVAALYATGAISSLYIAEAIWHLSPIYRTELMPECFNSANFCALIFSLLSAALFMRTWKAALTTPLTIGVWVVSFTVYCKLAASGSPLLGLSLAGATGGFGLVATDSLCHPRLLLPKHLATATAVGWLAGYAFVFFSHIYSLHSPSGRQVWGHIYTLPAATAERSDSVINLREGSIK